MLDQLICKLSANIFDVLQVINNNAKGIAFIIGDNNKFIGVLTDGDIRRVLLEGNDLNTPIKGIVNKHCTVANDGESFHEMLAKTNEKVNILPIVDVNNILVDFFQYQNNVYVPVASPNLRGNEFKYLVDAFLSTWISSSGKYIGQFEEKFSSYCECQHGVAVSNGTVAIHLALITLGIGTGDEVIIPDLTFAATINAVLHAGATPVIVDVDIDSWCIDPLEIEKAISPKTKAIIPVHLYGQSCDMESIMKIASKNKLFVIEDCAEAHGAEYKGKKVGSFGDISTFSFFANKIITTGEGGMCVTNSKELSDKMCVLRDHGMSKTRKYWHTAVGYNYRMTNLQAAIGVAQLERIDEILTYRRQIENDYRSFLSTFPFIKFQKNIEDRHRVTWLVSAILETNKRDELIIRLKDENIDARPFFFPLGEMDIYKEFLFSNQNSQKLSIQGINFPTSEKLSSSVKERILEIFNKL
ncbi:aminotransferase class I/II-fold pyridoxal phosphate-dependent enzyme [Crocinitomix catalasitica]|uniref:aminotransferase class I/II-fold pyridoxal phosphate-dependent enzyme n=1 Tax=Crocinitomix catalasitica TaxID=184607 RepID=UPI000484BF46|nr:aminotransferase class I/II-fold pyridoxal phosphate-dependent enzyme [Crocinitomix catalasitica]